jgi:hypothetical protein
MRRPIAVWDGNTAMEITFTCLHCGEVTLIDESFIGQSGPCRSCDAIVTVPKIFVGIPLCASVGTGANLGPASPPMPWMKWMGWAALLVPILCILLLPMLASVQSHRPAERMEAQNGLRQIMSALQAYDAQWGKLPRVYWRDEAGELVLPWRAAILPYVEEQITFRYYAKNEPWNSPNNYAVTDHPVRAFTHPGDMLGQRTHTGYVAVTGPGSLFVEGQDKRLSDCKLDPSRTIVLVEIPDSDVHWSEPVDVDLFVQFFQKKNSNAHERRFYWRDGAEVAFADGSIRHLTTKQLEEALRAMCSSATTEELQARFGALSE